MRESEISDFGVPTGGRIISNLRYADDTAILVNGSSNPSDALERLDHAGRRRGLMPHVKKTKWLSTAGMDANITIAGQQIERVGAFSTWAPSKQGMVTARRTSGQGL